MNTQWGMTLVALMFLVGPNVWAQFDDLEVTLTPAAREYCHAVRFPQGWAIRRHEERTSQRLFFGLEYSDYEFRAEGALSTEFLVAGFTDFVGYKNYTTNHYRVNLANPSAPIVPASQKSWDDATVILFARKSPLLPKRIPDEDKPFQFHGLEFTKSGDIWAQAYFAAALLSPDQAWLVLQSGDRQGDQKRARVFFDFFNADTGQKLFTLEGIFTSLHLGEYAEEALAKTGWVTERFFIVPLGRFRERCLVCDFGKRTTKKGAKQ